MSTLPTEPAPPTAPTVVTYTSAEVLTKLRALLEDISFAPDSAADLVEDLIFEVEADEVDAMTPEQCKAYLIANGFSEKGLDDMANHLMEHMKALRATSPSL